MEESVASTVPDGEIVGIQFGLASHHEICKASINDCPISHASQLANPFLGLPLETGKCESCGTAELGKCEGHFGYIELPIPVYHPSHVSELRRMLSLLCLKCLKLKTSKPARSNGVMERLLSGCCEEASHVSIKESKTNDGASFLELRLPARYSVQEGSWNFLEKFGFRYGDGSSRTLLPSEVLVILKKLPLDTKRKLARKGYCPQDGYILRYLPVPPNCLSVPDISDGVSVMSSDLSATMLKKVLRQIEIIRSSRSGEPNFESHEVEANELQIAVSQYLQSRGTGKASRDADNRYGVTKDGNNSSTKAWLEKMRTLFISKGSGFSSRSVITGDAFKAVNDIGLPSEIAQKMTFEERVNVHNIQYLQALVDNNLCLTFRDGMSTYSLREGSKGHTFLRLGQVVHRRIMDGDIVFINRPPTTHKHSLQALRVYIHDDHTVKINPLMCGPLAADFDGDCVHLFYPQSLSARAEVMELFSVEKQLLSSHSGNLNLQLATDSLLSLKSMFKVYFLGKESAQQLAMYASTPLPFPAIPKACSSGPRWTALQVLQTALPSKFDCHGDRLLVRGSEVVKLDFNRDAMAAVINEILTSLFFNKSPKEALKFFDSLQPLLMENLFSQGFSVGLEDLFIPMSELQSLQSQIQDISPVLVQLRSSFNELVQLQFENHIRLLKVPVANFILKSSALGNLIDSRSDSAVEKVVQQIGFLGLQLSDKRKFYSRGLVDEVASLFRRKYPFASVYPTEEFGLVKSCFFRGLDPYEEIVHSIATREVIVRSSKGLAEPGTLFKNLMAILRDVVICYDGSVRNISSNSIIQFEYGVGGVPTQSLFPAGEPVGVLAATAMSNPAYKAVLDSSPSSNSSWDMMKEILFCRVNFKNDLNDRRVILYLNDCQCGRRYCQENASYLVKNHLQKVSLRDAAVEFLIEYKQSKAEPGSPELDTGLVGHIHLNKAQLNDANISMDELLQKCEDEVDKLRRKKKYGYLFKRLNLSVSDCCFFKHSSSKWCNMPCLKFFWPDMTDVHLEKTSHVMADLICPILLDTIIKGDPRISTVKIVWISPDTTTWVQGPCSSSKGELAVEATLEKTAVRQNGDAWRIVLDCCLPVFHLIDHRRSIPYAIKQIQHLFGISCAFDQAVQRLSTSVTLVTKGVLKEHLILLASSMTCAGNLVGFNMSGIKALCRALSVQVPFTEATLYTPRKCFERASEKCHVDSLTSIVASCSWGKHVAVGTGAKFDILWDTKQTGTGDQQVDVYNLLQLLHSSNEETIDAGLGEDVDTFDWEDTMEPALSPDQEVKAVFEDRVEVGWDDNKSETFGGGSGTSESNGWSSWDLKKDNSKDEAGGWGASKSYDGTNPPQPSSAWGKSAKENDNTSWQKKDSLITSEQSGGWDDKAGGWGASKSNPPEPSSAWGKPAKKTDNTGWQKKDSQRDLMTCEQSGAWDDRAGGWGAAKSYNGNNTSEPSSAWGKPANPTTRGQSGGWDDKVAKEVNIVPSSDCEGKSESRQEAPADAGIWESQKKENQVQSSWGKQSDSTSKSSDEGWKSQKEEGKAQSSWGQAAGSTWKNSSGSGGQWNSKTANKEVGPKAWESKKGESNTQSSWGQPNETSWKNSTGNAGGWSTVKVNEEAGPGSWGSRKGESKTQSSWEQPNETSWKNSTGNAGGWSTVKVNEEAGPGSWGSRKGESKTQSSWEQPAETTWKNSPQSAGGWKSKTANKEVGPKTWESKKGESNAQSSWGKPSEASWKNSSGNAGGWVAEKVNEDAGPGSWGSRKGESKTQSSWGQPADTTWKESTQAAGGSSSEKENDQAGSKIWVSEKDVHETESSWGTWKKPIQNADGWGSIKSNQPSSSQGVHGWGSSNSRESEKEHKAQSSWGQSSESGKSTSKCDDGWGMENANDQAGSNWESKKEECKTQPLWGQSSDSSWKSTQKADEWGSIKSNPPGSSQGGRGWGSSNSGEWKSRRNHPPKQAGMSNDESTRVAVPATRVPMDRFTPEEQDALSEVKAVNQSIKRIMQQCKDGDPLPAEDQSYIINNVLNHHPDKEAKMGAGIEYITVQKHIKFQDTRCFYVVSTDGRTEDFSYRKSLMNLVEVKYPSVAESFNSKYFRKQQGGRNDQQTQEE